MEAMKVNGTIKESEEAIFRTFQMETDLLGYEVKNSSRDLMVKALKKSSVQVKRAIIIELAGVLDADQEIDENEEAWIIKLGEDWDFRASEIRRMLRWVEDFNDLLNEGYTYIIK